MTPKMEHSFQHTKVHKVQLEKDIFFPNKISTFLVKLRFPTRKHTYITYTHTLHAYIHVHAYIRTYRHTDIQNTGIEKRRQSLSILTIRKKDKMTR